MGYLIAMTILFGVSTLLVLLGIGSYAQMKEVDPKWEPDPPSKNTTFRRVLRLLGGSIGTFAMWQVVLLSPGLFIYAVFAVYVATLVVGLIRCLTQERDPAYSQGGAAGTLLYTLGMTICLIGFGLYV
jgi:FtsH-binding integral membrane protein